MKVNTIRKYKWYLFGAIAVVLIMSIGLSFCSWDTNSIANSVSGRIADFKNTPHFANKNVGDVFADSTGLEWLIVDKTSNNGVTDMVLMTNRVTEARAYEPTMTTADYNNPKNNIRDYLNNSWYPTIGEDIKQFTVQRMITYPSAADYPGNPILPTFFAPTYNWAWVPSAVEVGLYITNWSYSIPYGNKFQYFTRSDVNRVVHDGGAHPCRIALDTTGVARKWWTRSATNIWYTTTIGETGGTQEGGLIDRTDYLNWMRPCVQIRFITK